ncbi:substrate-binding domain-containing protein [Biomaibacter acetigenes]|jgi:ribose transport system substrate-binding protein|nr:substrate-binding domain-containing protein [Biomaibacter acetigenes]MDK2799295.1 ribose transport system substrate-binding protein [Clostridiales bacterium]
MKRNKLLKKFMVISIILAVCISMVACSSGQQSAKQQNQSAQPKEQGQKKILIAFSQGTMNHPFRIAMVERNKEYAEKNYPDVEFIATDGQNTSSKQVADVEDLIAKKPNVLIVSPLTEAALTPPVQKAMDMGIPVVTLDRKVNTKVTCHIGAKNYPMGVKAAEFIAKALNGKGNIIEIQGTAGASATVERDKGFRDTIAKYPDMKIIADQYCDYVREPAMKFMEDMLQRFPKGQIQAIYSHNDAMAMAAIEAIKAAGRMDEIKVITGMDGENLAFDSIKKGELTATIIYPYCAPEGVQYAYKIAKGEKVPEEVVLEGDLVTKENVDKYIGKGI